VRAVASLVEEFPAVELNDAWNTYEVNSAIRFLEDKNNSLTIEDVMQLEHEQSFEVGSEGPLNLGYSRSAFWIKLPVQYVGKKISAEWLYQLNLPLLDYSEFYKVVEIDGERSIIENKSISYDTLLKDREVYHVTPVYRFSLKKNEQAIIYLKIKTNYTIHLPLTIYSPDGFARKSTIEDYLYGAFVGSVLIMIAYNIFMFLSVRERSFLYYIFYMISYLSFITTERVQGLTLFDEIPMMFHKQYLPYYVWSGWFFALLMARSFLDTKKNEPELDRLIKLFLKITVISLVITYYADPVSAIQWGILGTLTYAVLVSWMAFKVMMKGNPAARFYFIAWILNFSGAWIYALTVIGYLPFNFITSNSPHIGMLCQIVLISFALADQIKVAQRKASEASKQAVVNLGRYRSLFDNAVEGIFQISLNRRFIDANPAMAGMLEHRDPEHLINGVNDALARCYPQEEDYNKVVKAIEQGTEIHEFEARYTGLSGSDRWALSTMRVIYDRNNMPMHLEGTFVDITERMEREELEREHEKERMRTEVAEASAAAKSQFLANMSHEIRTPLTAIIGYGESLLDDSLNDEEKRESSEVVVRSGQHLLQLINDILDHSKIDADKLETEIITVNLLSLLDEIKTYFKSRAAEKNVYFTVQYDFPLPEKIQTDPTRLKQVLINLCANALKFTDKGGVSLAVRCDRNNEKLTIKVVDTGIGVKQEQLDKLFDPFAQASPSIARQYGGTGLGLSISLRLTEMLGGSITASSVFGEGSEFEVTISTGSLNECKFIRDRSELALSRPTLGTVSVPRLKGRILYAEDNEINRRLIKQLVSKTGASISLVVNGAEALEAGTRSGEPFDLILMDIQMPVMDGRDATVALREAGVNTPIVALTANVMLQDIAEYKEAGCNEVMAKPVEKVPFYQMLARYIKEDDSVEPMKKLSGRVLVAEDGRQAVSAAMRETLNLILMDQHMPEMNGPEAIKLLRQTGFRRPILAFTASDEAEEIAVMMKAGCNGVVEKPIKLEQLYQEVSKYLPSSCDIKIGEGSGKPWDDPDIKPIVQQFVKGIPKRIITMKKSLSESDWSSLRSQAHQVKGTAGSLGFPDLTKRATSLEMALRNDDIEDVDRLLKALEIEAERAMEDFNEAENISN
jgi:two-component system, sensor histidine kinase LadS